MKHRKELIGKVKSQRAKRSDVAITTDGCTSIHKKQTITAPCLNDEWEMKWVVLEPWKLTGRHTGEAIAENESRGLEYWDGKDLTVVRLNLAVKKGLGIKQYSKDKSLIRFSTNLPVQ